MAATGNLLTITCVQSRIVPGDPDANTGLAESWLDQCATIPDHPHLILFPEYFLQGLTEHNARLAQGLDGPFGRVMLARAQRLHAYIFAGLLETSPDPQRPYNSIGIWGPRGIVGSYRKTHLYDWGHAYPDHLREAKAFLPGDRLGLFEIEGLTIGVMTCADGLVVEVPRALTLSGADVILYPNGREFIPAEHAEYHVHANAVPLAVANGWGSVGPEIMGGGSRILSATQDPVSARSDGPDQISATFLVSVLRQTRRTHWPLCARRPELYVSAHEKSPTV